MPSVRSRVSTYLKIGSEQVAVEATTFTRRKEPRLRFDRTAVGFVDRLHAALAKSVPDGKTVIVTITAPIWQDSKTSAVLQDRIGHLLASGRTQLKTRVHGNRIQVRILKGGTRRTSKLIGFVHNPKPDPALLFELTGSLLACMGSRRPLADRWLIIANQDGLAPVETLRQVYRALRAQTIFKAILLAEREGGVTVL